MTKTLSLALFLALYLPTGSVFAYWTVSQLDTLTQSFQTAISANYKVQVYPFQFLDTSTCFDPGNTCGFSNPDGPYAFPTIPGRGTAKMLKTDALVLIMETPPSMRYFGVTPYLYMRYYSTPTVTHPGYVKVFESLSDSVNMTEIGTTGSATPGSNVFTQLSVVVMTADSNTFKQVRAQLVNLGFPASAINLLAMPINDVPLKMGTSNSADLFTMLLRTAYPADPVQMSDYIARAPFRFMQLSAIKSRNLNALPAPINKIPGTGVSEAPALATARDQLVTQLVTQYGSAYSITEVNAFDRQTNNYVCIQSASMCSGDNSDAIYGHELDHWIPGNKVNGIPEDKLLIVGVNHVLARKAVYVSYAVVEDLHQVGVAAVSDTWLQNTALTMAGITTSNDPRYATYSSLYAFTIGYDCNGELVCLTIPQPTATQMGVAIGDNIDVTGRTYVELVTGTRPSTSEVIGSRVFLLQRKL